MWGGDWPCPQVEDGAASPPSSLVQEPSIVSLAKAVKNPVEMDGMREAHLRDAVALASFFCWLEGEVAKASAWHGRWRACRPAGGTACTRGGGCRIQASPLLPGHSRRAPSWTRWPLATSCWASAASSRALSSRPSPPSRARTPTAPSSTTGRSWGRTTRPSSRRAQAGPHREWPGRGTLDSS